MKLTINQTLQQAVTAHQEGKLEEAEKLYKKILDTEPTNLDANKNLSILLLKLGKLDEAETSCKKTIELKPDFMECYYDLGNILYQLGKLDEAEKNFQKVIELKPDHIEAYFNLSIIFRDLDRFDEAEKNFKKVIELKPDHIEAYYNLGTTNYKLDRLDEAEKNFKKVIELKPDHIGVHFILGINYKKQKKLSMAISSFYRHIIIKPDDHQARYYLGSLLENEAKFHYGYAFEKTKDTKKFYEEKLKSKKLIKKNILIEKNIIGYLNKLSKDINNLYGFINIEKDEKSTPSINNGPCGAFANEFYIEWNLRFNNKVKIAFVMRPIPFESMHVLIKLPNENLFDGGVGVHDIETYKKKGLTLMTMEEYDIKTLDKYSWGLNKIHPKCPSFSINKISSLITECLEKF